MKEYQTPMIEIIHLSNDIVMESVGWWQDDPYTDPRNDFG